MKYKYFLSIILLFASAGLLLGHGVHVEVKQFSPLILVTSGYSAANPLKDASVSVFAPGEEEIFQNGRTDKCGVFSFKPDRAGAWKFVVDDEMGHKKETIIEINEAFFTKTPPQSSGNSSAQQPAVFCALPISLKLLIGLSLIFGIFGIFSLIKARKTSS